MGLLSFATHQVWTKVFVCTLSKSTGGFQLFLSPCLSSSMMKLERAFFVNEDLTAGLQRRPTTKCKIASYTPPLQIKLPSTTYLCYANLIELKCTLLIRFGLKKIFIPRYSQT